MWPGFVFRRHSWTNHEEVRGAGLGELCTGRSLLVVAPGVIRLNVNYRKQGGVPFKIRVYMSAGIVQEITVLQFAFVK